MLVTVGTDVEVGVVVVGGVVVGVAVGVVVVGGVVPGVVVLGGTDVVEVVDGPGGVVVVAVVVEVVRGRYR